MKYIAYLRESTEDQKLGIEAQRAAVRRHAGADILKMYTEHESGRRSDRPELKRALEHAHDAHATLIVATLSRLTRNVAFLCQLQESGVDFIALDCPGANRSMVQMMAVMAEWEASQISVRTKQALAESKKPLGGANPRCRNLTKANAAKGRLIGVANHVAKTDAYYATILPKMVVLRDDDSMTFAEIAAHLNSEGYPTRTGKTWTVGTVANVLRRE